MSVTWRVSCPTVVGRAEQLTGLRLAIGAAGQHGVSLMLVAGPAGMGKTRLIREAASGAAGTGREVIEGACLPLGHPLPYGPFAEALGHRIFAGEDRLALFRATADALAGQAAGAGLVVVLEDLHWADASTCDLLVFCARMLASQPVLIIGSYRTDHAAPHAAAGSPFTTVLADLGSAPWLRQLELSPLSWSQTAEQIAGIRGCAPPAELVDRVYGRCGGNPFYAEELLAADPVAEQLPPALREAVLSRLTRLGPEACAVARLLAVAGPRTHRRLLLAACPLGPDGIDAGMAALTAGGLVRPAGVGYEFRHALVREAVLAALGPAERAAAHRQVAELLTQRPELAVTTTPGGLAAQRAHHWEAAGEPVRALGETLAAASAAESMTAPTEALTALACLLQSDPPSAALATVLARQADLYLTLLRNEECIEVSQRAIEVAQTASAPEAEGIARLALGRAICRAGAGDDDDAVAQMRRGLELVRQHGDLRSRTMAIYHTAMVLGSLSRFDAALAVAGDGYEELSRLGASPDQLIMLRLAQAQALQRLGRLAAAESLLAAVEPAPTVAEVIRQAALAEILVLSGRLADAQAILAGLLGDPRGRDPQFRDVLTSLQVKVLAAGRQWDEARGHALAGLRSAGAAGTAGMAGTADAAGYRDCAAGLRLEADRTEAGLADDGTRPAADELLAALSALSGREQRRRQPRPEATCYTMLAQADAARALDADHAQLWRLAVEAADATIEPWPQAYARYRLGVALLSAGGSRAEGAGRLAAARDIAQNMGARLLADEIAAAADRFRVAAGRRPQPPDPLARYRLTPRETEVLALVASGASNGEIGGRLFIGAKTASAHVTHILRKLGVSTRTQAAAIAYHAGLGRLPRSRP